MTKPCFTCIKVLPVIWQTTFSDPRLPPRDGAFFQQAEREWRGLTAREGDRARSRSRPQNEVERSAREFRRGASKGSASLAVFGGVVLQGEAKAGQSCATGAKSIPKCFCDASGEAVRSVPSGLYDRFGQGGADRLLEFPDAPVKGRGDGQNGSLPRVTLELFKMRQVLAVLLISKIRRKKANKWRVFFFGGGGGQDNLSWD